MKNLNKFVLALSMSGIALTFTSCKENNNESMQDEMEMEQEEMNHKEMDHGKMEYDQASVKAEFQNEEFTAVFQHYMHVKTALVNSDIAEAKSGGKMLAEAIGDSNEDIRVYSEKIASAEDIEVQREAFSELTSLLEPELKAALKSGEIYKQYCPMAFNNKGAAWLSSVKEIRNPYFGDKMLKCGTIKEVIQ